MNSPRIPSYPLTILAIDFFQLRPIGSNFSSLFALKQLLVYWLHRGSSLILANIADTLILITFILAIKLEALNLWKSYNFDINVT